MPSNFFFFQSIYNYKMLATIFFFKIKFSKMIFEISELHNEML